MKHRVGFNRLSRKASHRRAMLRNMVTSLFDHERITTTKAKALEVRRIAEKMITRAKTDSVHNRRMTARYIWDKAIVNKLYTEIGPRFAERNGGYCRILKIGHRQGDAADMAILELLGRNGEEEEKPAKEKAKKSKKETPKKEAPAKAEAPKEEAPKKETPAEEAPAADEPKAEAAEAEAGEAEEKSEE